MNKLFAPANARKLNSGFTHAIFKPHTIVPITILLSFLAWSFPAIPGLRKGFSQAEPITPTAVAILAAWYGLLIVCSYVGFSIGKLIPIPRIDSRIAAPLSSPRPYYLFTALGAIGVIYTYAMLLRRGALTGYLMSGGTTSANMLKEALYVDYSIGLFSLRYIAVVSCALAVYRAIQRSRWGLLEIINVICLLCVAFLSGRMLLMWASLIIAVLLASLQSRGLKRKASRLFLGVLVGLCALLWVFNYSRNLLYYRSIGSDSFLLSGISEIVAYVGTPMQATLGMANHWDQSLNGEAPSTFVEYDSATLTTVSALSELMPRLGSLALPYAGLQCLFFAGVAGWCSRQRGTYVYLGYPVVLYCFAELWRLDLFDYGVFKCLLILTLAAPLAAGTRKNALSRRNHAERPMLLRATS